MDRDKAIKYMRDLLKALIEKDGSDLFITVDFPPAMKIHGKVTPVSKILEYNYKVCNLILDLSSSYEKLVRKKKAA